MTSLASYSFVEQLASIGDADSDDRDLRVRKHAFAVTVASLVMAALLWTFVGLASGRSQLMAGSIVFCVAFAVTLVVFWRTKAFRPLVQLTLLLGIVYVAVGHASLGGLAAGAGSLVWGILAPVMAVLLLGTRESTRWFLIYAALALAAIVLDPVIADLAPATWTIPPPLLFAYNVFGPAIIVVLLVRYVDGQRDIAQRRYHGLLHEMLPPPVADRLARGERLIAEHHDSVSILFADLVDFTSFAEHARAADVLLTLNDLFTAFDLLARRLGVEKIKTIGDAYLAAAGAPLSRDDHADAAVQLAIAMQLEVRRRATMRSRGLTLRVGISSGPVTAGVIGRHRPAYDVWGDTVNLGSRMQSSGTPGMIQMTGATAALLRGKYPLQVRREVAVKGRAPMTTYLLDPVLASSGEVAPDVNVSPPDLTAEPAAPS
jgi:adenylate cyclase